MNAVDENAWGMERAADGLAPGSFTLSCEIRDSDHAFQDG